MGFLRRNANAKPDYTSLQIQTATSTLAIPIVWGRNKVAPNVIWFANFRAVPGSSGKGIGGKGGALGGGAAGNSYSYAADLIMALCEGPINGTDSSGKTLGSTSRSSSEIGIFNGTTPQDVWPYLAALYPYNALAYQGTAIAWAAGYNLGDSASVGNHNFEILGPLSGSSGVNDDADPAQVINDFLTNAQYGVGFDPASIDGGSLFTNPRFPPGLLQGDGLRLFAGSLQPRAGLEHPHPLAADLFDGSRVERRPAEVYPLRGYRDFVRGRNDLQHPAFCPGSNSCLIR